MLLPVLAVRTGHTNAGLKKVGLAKKQVLAPTAE
jgi:hypothetical protein